MHVRDFTHSAPGISHPDKFLGVGEPVSTDYSIQVANRIPFDIDEATNNKANYIKAVQLLKGNDDYATKMWWQR